MNEPKSQTNQNNPGSDPQQDQSIGLTIERKPDETIKGKNDTDTTNTENNPSKKSRTERIMASATVIIALATIAYAGIAFYQLDVMSKTLNEMKNSGNETKTQVDRMITETNRIAGAMTKTVEQSKASLDASINIARADQRAWLSITAANLKQLRAGQPLRVELKLFNTGKTPALNLKHWASLQTTPADIDVPTFIKKLREKAVPILSPIVLPDVPNSIPMSTSYNLTAEDVDAIQTEAKKVYVFIAVNYNDIFNRSHLMQFCASYYPSNNTFVTCRDFSYAN